MLRRLSFLSLLLLLTFQRVASDNDRCSSCNGSSEFDIFHLYTSAEKKELLIENPLNEAPRTKHIKHTEPSFQFSGSHSLKDNSSQLLHNLACTMCYHHEVTMQATLLFQTNDTGGPIMELSHELSPILGLDVNCKGNALSVHFSHQGQLVVEKFEVKFEIGIWYKMAVHLSGNLLKVYLDCKNIENRLISIPDYCSNSSSLLIQAGSDSDGRYYKGSLQGVRMVVSDSPLQKQCSSSISDIDDCPLCGSVLTTMKKMKAEQERLEIALEESRDKQSDCTNGIGGDVTGVGTSCLIDDISRPDGSFSKNQDGEICYCRNGNPLCIDPSSLTPSPSNVIITASTRVPSPSTVPAEGEPAAMLCPKKTVGNQEIVAEVGEMVYTKRNDGKCELNECVDSPFGGARYENPQVLDCEAVEDCSALTTDRERNVSLCCGICQACDFANCPAETTCVNMGLEFRCRCSQGYELSPDDGVTCIDRNECALGNQQGGHDCPAESTCVNTAGSFECKCPKFYEITTVNDRKQCTDINECNIPNFCPSNTTCYNAEPGYHCNCSENYRLEDDECKPICDLPCLNGGTCTSPGTCSCPSGFRGDQCQDDIDECMENTKICEFGGGNITKCINTLGGYFCTCRPGLQLIGGEKPRCKAIDECSTGLHRCPGNHTCLNGYKDYYCTCNGVECDGKCLTPDGRLMDDGSKETKGCDECTCQNGQYSCQRKTCDCLAHNESALCCPQCSKKDHCFGENGLILEVGKHHFDQDNPCSFTTCENRKDGTPVLKANNRVTCPTLSCPSNKTYTPPGACCPKCRLPTCTDLLEGRVFSIKNTATCEECSCNARSSEWTCITVDCSCPSLGDCPSKYVTNLKEGACPVCVKSSYSEETTCS